MKAELAAQGEILRGVVGSTALGLNLPGTDDRDEMAVFIEPIEYALGFKELDHWVTRTQPEGVRSQAGDLDSVAYSLTKYLKLALGGNPSVLMLLYLPESGLVSSTPLGEGLRELRGSIVSQKALPRFRGYLEGQKLRLKGERGQKNVKRPELVEKYGYDTKYAMHALRLGYQGIELAQYGGLSIPLRDSVRDMCLAARMGQFTLDEVLSIIEQHEDDLDKLMTSSRILREEPDYEKVYGWAVGAYVMRWFEV